MSKCECYKTHEVLDELVIYLVQKGKTDSAREVQEYIRIHIDHPQPTTKSEG